MILHRRTRLAAFAFVAACVGPASANLLTNASFESPGCAGNCILPGGSTFVTGWTALFSGAEYFQPTLYGGSAPDGVMAVDLANYVYDHGGIAQSFSTVVGQKYTIEFWAGNLQASGRTGDGLIRVQAGDLDTVVATPVSSGAWVWSQVKLDFTATGTTTTLSFSNEQSAYTHFALIDGASVAAVPEPQSWVLALGGLAFVGAALRRRA